MAGSRGTSLTEEIHASLSNHSFSVWNSVSIWVQNYILNTKDNRFYENELFKHVQLDSFKKLEVIDTVIEYQDEKYKIHEVCISNYGKDETDGGDSDAEVNEIVVVHGYSASLGFFYKNFNGLSNMKNCRIHFIDLLGFGLSDRPYFKPMNTTKYNHNFANVLDNENFFIDSFEIWRRERSIKRFSIIAHSLGGYLMNCYYLKYGKSSNLIKKLILISPVGIEDSNFSLFKEFEDSFDNLENSKKLSIDEEFNIVKNEGIDLSKELTDHLHCETSNLQDNNRLHRSLSITSIESNDEVKIEKLMKQIKTRVIPGKILTKLWEFNFTPLNIVRMFGPLSGKVIAIWVYNRFSNIENQSELFDICNYITSIFTERGSGEYALNGILGPGSLARLPLIKRVPKYMKIPVLLLYGENDWMDKNAGLDFCNEINNNGGSAKFRIVANAGHHLYVDNPAEFERQARQFLG